MAKKLNESTTTKAASASSAYSSKTKSKPKPSKTVLPVETTIAKPKRRKLKQDAAESFVGDAEDDDDQGGVKNENEKVVEGAEKTGKVKSGKGRSGDKSKEVTWGQKTLNAAPSVKANSTSEKSKRSVAADTRPTEIIEVEVEDDEEEWAGFGGATETELVEVEPQRSKQAKIQAEEKSDASKSKKTTPKKKTPQPEPEAEDGDDGTKDDDYLHGFSSDDQDSSDEDDMVDDAPALDVYKLPTIAKDDKTVKQKLDQAKRLPTDDRGVIYLGRIPHGFYEDQMKMYFTQFGEVTRIRLSRNRKTGRSKHYAFIEFDSSRVAEIVSETMDNYLLMGHILRCKVLPKTEIHPELWVGANRKFKVLPRARLERVCHNKLRTESEQSRAGDRLVRRQRLKKRKLAEIGIEYNFDAAAYKKKPKIAET